MHPENKRRHPRVRVQRTHAEVMRALGGHIVWPNLETSDILDISLKGCAVRRPGVQPITPGHVVQVDFELGLEPAFTAKVRVAWHSGDRVGLEVDVLETSGRLVLDGYLSAKLMGSSLKAVKRSHCSAGEDFHHWFQGPKDTHVFVWLDTVGRVDRVRIDKEGAVYEILRGGRFVKPSRGERSALLLLSHMDNSGLPMEEFVRSFDGE